MAVLGVAQREVFVHHVGVPATVAASRQVPGLLEVTDDLGSRSLGDPDGLRDVTKPRGWVGGDGLEHVGVVCYEPKCM